jgi:hypothetical protein
MGSLCQQDNYLSGNSTNQLIRSNRLEKVNILVGGEFFDTLQAKSTGKVYIILSVIIKHIGENQETHGKNEFPNSLW